MSLVITIVLFALGIWLGTVFALPVLFALTVAGIILMVVFRPGPDDGLAGFLGVLLVIWIGAFLVGLWGGAIFVNGWYHISIPREWILR